MLTLGPASSEPDKPQTNGNVEMREAEVSASNEGIASTDLPSAKKDLFPVFQKGAK